MRQPVVAYLLFFLLFSSFLTGQSLEFRRLGKVDGLSQSSVFAITQDEYGFMWFGTRNGLNKYDGYRFTVFHQDERGYDGPPGNDVRALFYDKRGHELWIATLSGLSRYDPLTDRFYNYRQDGKPGALGSNFVRSVIRDHVGRVWVASEAGLQRYRPESDDFVYARGIGNGPVNVVYEDPGGRIWAGTPTGLFRLGSVADTLAQFELVGLPPVGDAAGLPYDIRVLLADRAGHLWIGTHNAGLLKYRPASSELQRYRHDPDEEHSLSHDQVRALSLSPEGEIWIGTFVGLNRYCSQDDHFLRYLPEKGRSGSLSNESIRSLFFDGRGAIWVGSYYGGLNYHESSLNQFRNYQSTSSGEGISNNVVSSFAEDRHGDIWIGTEGGGLNHYDPDNERFINYPVGDNHPYRPGGRNVKTLLPDGDSLWIGTFERGLDLLNVTTGRFRHFRRRAEGSGLSSDNVYALVREDDRLWMATFGGGLNVMDLERDTVYHYRNDDHPAAISSDRARTLLRDRHGVFWVGTNRGLNRVDRSGPGALPRGFVTILPNLQILATTQAKGDGLWVGTFNRGLYHLSGAGKILGHYEGKDGLPGRSVFGILHDDNGHLWLSTDHGLSRFDPDKVTFTNYDHSNGLHNLEFNFNAYCRLRNGEMLFGGNRGFTRFDPASVGTHHYVAPLAFTGLRHFNEAAKVGASPLDRSLNETEHIRFRYNQANFTIQFAMLDFLNPDNNRYAYLLEGLDAEWTEARGVEEVSYTLQRPGDYLFRLRGANSDGVWNPTERRLLITVAPPPWSSPWAYGVYAFLLVGGLFAGFYFMRWRHRMQMEQLEHAQAERLHSAKIRFFTNITHEFRTPLTLILGPVEELIDRQEVGAAALRKLRSVQHNTNRLLDLVNQLLTFRKMEEEEERLAVAEGDFTKFCQEIFLSFSEHARIRKISYHFFPGRDVIRLFYDRDKMEKVIYNLLSNAFKFTPDGGRVEFRLGSDGVRTRLSVKDSGKGIPPRLHERIFNRFFEGESSGIHPHTGSGIGLAIAKRMVTLHHGKIRVESEEGMGANFILELPHDPARFKPEDIIPEFRDSEDIRGYPSVTTNGREERSDDEALFSRITTEASLSLLIVEDNPDVREYVLGVFPAHYRITTAIDGEEGLAKALEVLPDLIISDVMMPRMDGITLCRKLKTDVRTSHIPIILLTARTGTIFKLEGLETGADDYVTKPFTPRELILRTRNILAGRAKIRDKFARLSNLDPSEVAVTSADEKFLSRAIELVEIQMGNPNFSVDQFAYEVSVSRAVLFTKIKALTAMTPNNFVKSIRLKRAAQLLRQQKLSIAEVAYEVGFNDPRYFSKCFRKTYRKTPSEYAEELPQNK